MIANGYATLTEVKAAFLAQMTVTANEISFDSATKKISDASYHLRRFADGEIVQVSGSASNDGYYTIATNGGNHAGYITVVESLADEAAGESVTITGLKEMDSDARIESVIEAVSRLIDGYCRRRFYAVSEARYYTADDSYEIYIDDLLSVTELATDEDGDRTYETVWDATDFDLLPFNATLDSWPFSSIAITSEGDHAFPRVRKGVRVTGSFGFCTISSVPKPVKEAAVLQTVRLYRRKDAPFGVMGSADMGQIVVVPKLDPDLALLLAPYVRMM